MYNPSPEHAVVNELTYRSYCWQRFEFPEVDYHRWAKIFGGLTAVEIMESMYIDQFVRARFKAINGEDFSKLN